MLIPFQINQKLFYTTTYILWIINICIVCCIWNPIYFCPCSFRPLFIILFHFSCVILFSYQNQQWTGYLAIKDCAIYPPIDCPTNTTDLSCKSFIILNIAATARSYEKSIYGLDFPCAGAKSTDAIINNIDLLIIPLNKKITDGIIDNDTALKTVFLLKQMNHIAQ